MVYVVCVNDGAVMAAWKKDQGLAGSDLIEFAADTHATLTDALGTKKCQNWQQETRRPVVLCPSWPMAVRLL